MADDRKGRDVPLGRDRTGEFTTVGTPLPLRVTPPPRNPPPANPPPPNPSAGDDGTRGDLRVTEDGSIRTTMDGGVRITQAGAISFLTTEEGRRITTGDGTPIVVFDSGAVSENIETGTEAADAVSAKLDALPLPNRIDVNPDDAKWDRDLWQDSYSAEVIPGIWGPSGGLIPGALDKAEADIVALLELRRADQSANAVVGIGHNRAPEPIGDVEAETLETALVAIRAYRKQLDQPEPDRDVLALVLPALRAAMSVIGRFAKWMADGGVHYLKIILDNAAAEFGKSIGKPKGIAGWLALYTALAYGTSKDWELLIQALEKVLGP